MNPWLAALFIMGCLGLVRSLERPLSRWFLASGALFVAGNAGATPPSLLDLVKIITGQPNVECEDVGDPPGNSATAPGSAFNEDGKAHSVYAGEQPQNSKNPNSVSQYDVACARP